MFSLLQTGKLGTGLIYMKNRIKTGSKGNEMYCFKVSAGSSSIQSKYKTNTISIYSDIFCLHATRSNHTTKEYNETMHKYNT